MEIVVDFDGTLALGDTSNINDMRPNLKLIHHINKMYEDGNIIKIVTARGSKSCKTLKDRSKKYKQIIQQWLDSYSVKYDVLSFCKEYGDVYIDDRVCDVETPIFYKNFNTNFTTNNVKRFNNRVYKHGEEHTICNEITWFKHAAKLKLPTPYILTYDSNAISMTYYDTTLPYTKDISSLIHILDIFKNSQAINSADINTYKQRIQHYINNNLIFSKHKLLKKLDILSLPQTFNHGDFSSRNILHTDCGLILIDPIFETNLFQSYQLDIAKFLFTVLFFEKDSELYEMTKSQCIKRFNVDTDTLNTLIICEGLRVANRKKQLLDVINNLIESL